MSTRTANRHETRTALLEVGMLMMMERGYTNTGIQEVLSSLKVPKGSFYHYFESKEAYAVEIIHHFDEAYAANLVRLLRNLDRRPIDRLRDYFDENKSHMVAQDCRKGCLIGTLSQEMADQSEVLRTELSLVMNKWRDLIASCIQEAQTANEIQTRRDPIQLAELLSAAWSGAVMRAKTLKSIEPLDTIHELIFSEILRVTDSSDNSQSFV